jgi:hypothetical protein
VPALEIPTQLLIEHAGSDLQQMVDTRWGPPHLLFLHKPLADNLVDRRFDEAGGDAVHRRPLFREIRQTSTISAHIIPKLFDDLFGSLNRLGAAARVLGRPSVDVSAQPRELEERSP